MKTEYAEDDLSYEELTVNRQVSLESSYWQKINRTLELNCIMSNEKTFKHLLENW
jgi:hypothetical protein